MPIVSLALALGGCGEPAPSAISLLQAAQTNFSNAQSFHVLYIVEEAQQLTHSDLFYLTRAEGDIERPDKLSATVDALTPSGPRHGAKVIVIGGQGWLANSQTDQYQRDDEVVTFARLFDAQIGLGALLTQIEQPSSPQSNKDIWVTYGSVPADALRPMFPALAGRTDPVMVDVDISQRDHQLVGLNLTGVLFPGESHPYSHIFSFSGFGAPVSIQPPAGV
jgi:hypothetical protein